MAHIWIGKPLELHQVPGLLNLDEDFGKFSQLLLFISLIFAAVSCLSGIVSEKSECSQHARHLIYIVPFYLYTLLPAKEELRLRHIKEPVANTSLVNPELGSDSLLVWSQSLTPEPLQSHSEWLHSLLFWDEQVPAVNARLHLWANCLACSQKRCLETKIWVRVSLITIEMSLLPGSFREQI